MDEALLDTDILSEVLKGVDPNVLAKASSYRSQFEHYLVSTVTVMEVVKGLHRRNREDDIRRFMALPGVKLLTLDSRSAELAGRIDAELELAGQPIGRADPMIAAIALRHGLTLVTGNLLRYQRIQSLGYRLKLDNWRA